ncbi:MAG TPA: methyltransferase [Thermoanaerobaculia bacterium]|nr:methyltransferase [Thermoanaerobaculia bacterium]
MSEPSPGVSEPSYRGWVRPGPIPPGGVEVEEGETLDFLCGYYRIFQYAKGHRYSTDDVLTAWYGTQWAPRVERAADLGSGIGSVAMISAWRLPGATFCTVEAQSISIRLARKSIRYNGLENRFRPYEGDLRDETVLGHELPFDLVTGSPPYFPKGTAAPADHPQAVGARIETRGAIEDYARAASRILGLGGLFAFVFPMNQLDRVIDALAASGLVLLRYRPVVFREGDAPLIGLFAASRAADLPVSFTSPREGKPVVESPLIIRTRKGGVHPEYATVRLSFGFPPGDVAAHE